MTDEKDTRIPPRPWRALPSPDLEDWGRSGGIVDAEGDSVVVTDSGYYPPNSRTAELIVQAVNAAKDWPS